MLHILELDTELLENILYHCNKESFLLLNKTCHLFIKQRKNFKSIIDQIILKKIKKYDKKLKKQSLACMFYKHESALTSQQLHLSTHALHSSPQTAHELHLHSYATSSQQQHTKA